MKRPTQSQSPSREAPPIPLLALAVLALALVGHLGRTLESEHTKDSILTYADFRDEDAAPVTALLGEFHRRLESWRDGHRDPAIADDLATAAGVEAALRFARAELQLVQVVLDRQHQYLTIDDLRDARFWQHALDAEIEALAERLARTARPGGH